MYERERIYKSGYDNLEIAYDSWCKIVFYGHVRLDGKTADADLLWEKNNVISLKRYGW